MYGKSSVVPIHYLAAGDVVRQDDGTWAQILGFSIYSREAFRVEYRARVGAPSFSVVYDANAQVEVLNIEL